MHINYADRNLHSANCDWIGGTDSENEGLFYAEGTQLVLPFASDRVQSQMLRDLSGALLDCINWKFDKFLIEIESKSHIHAVHALRWEAAMKEARAKEGWESGLEADSGEDSEEETVDEKM